MNVDNAVDPTGCGDAYRAGLLLGLEKGWDWQTSGRVGSLIGAIKVQQEGTQNHQFSMDEFAQQYETSFLRHKFEIDTSTSTIGETICEFVGKLTPHLQSEDRQKLR